MAKILSMGPTRQLDQVAVPADFSPWRLSDVLRTLDVWRQRRRERGHLAQLDARLLNDIGVHSHEVDEEIRKPFWRA